MARANINFSLAGATSETYKQFITNLRTTLTINTHKVYDIPVLVATTTVTGLARFILVDLTNYNAETVTIAIDIVDVFIVAYRTGNKAYFFQKVSTEAQDVLFQGIEHKTLPFKGNYDDLERCAGRILRAEIELGFSELESSIGNLFHYTVGNSVPHAFIVIIQSIAEAARFKYIEKIISESEKTKFKPDPGFLSLQNRWSKLSKQIQKAQTRGGKFEDPIEVRSASNKPILVSDVNSPVVKGMALLLNKPSEDGEIGLKEEVYEKWENAQGAFGIDF